MMEDTAVTQSIVAELLEEILNKAEGEYGRVKKVEAVPVFGSTPTQSRENHNL